MAISERSGQNLGSALTRLHLLDERLNHLDPNAPDQPDFEDVLARLAAAEALLQRYWMTIFEGAATAYDGTAPSLTPADPLVFDDGWGGVVRAVFGTWAHGQASEDLIAARVLGNSLAEQLNLLRTRVDDIEAAQADHAARIAMLEAS